MHTGCLTGRQAPHNARQGRYRWAANVGGSLERNSKQEVAGWYQLRIGGVPLGWGPAGGDFAKGGAYPTSALGKKECRFPKRAATPTGTTGCWTRQTPGKAGRVA